MKEPSEEVKRVEQRYEKALDDMEKHYKDVLEQIRAEIEAEITPNLSDEQTQAFAYVLQIIDRYMKGE